MIPSSMRVLAVLTLALALAPAALAQEEDDAVLKLAEPDFTIVGLPTSLRLATFKSAFRVTHRFTRPLGEGTVGDLADDLFGIDSGALIGLEYRFGIVPGSQIGLHRTSDKTIAFFGEYGVLRQSPRRPVDVTAVVAVEGTDNFRERYSPSLGAIVSRRVGDLAALYVEPIWVSNTNPLPAAIVEHDDTVMIGLGARLRIRPSVYIVGEFAPRVSGHAPGVHHGSFAIEKRAGGHLFQLNFSNSFGTTMASIARGGFRSTDWYMGFNISRKFF